MKTIEEIRGRCVITDDGHWLWDGALRPDGRPNIWAPDHASGKMATQCGPRAVWHCITGRPIKEGWRAYGTCDEKACCNPDHVACTTETAYGKWVASTGAFKGQTNRILANRASSRARSKLSPALITEIQISNETGRALALRLGLQETLVSRARRGQVKVFQSANVFAALLLA